MVEYVPVCRRGLTGCESKGAERAAFASNRRELSACNFFISSGYFDLFRFIYAGGCPQIKRFTLANWNRKTHPMAIFNELNDAIVGTGGFLNVCESRGNSPRVPDTLRGSSCRVTDLAGVSTTIESSTPIDGC